MIDDQLRQFMTQMESAIQALGAPPMKKRDAFLAHQKAHWERLYEMECQFKADLLAHPKGLDVCQRWMEAVTSGTGKGMLPSRVYFRERQVTFAASISAELASRNLAAVLTHNLNYRWIRWVASQEPTKGKRWPVKMRQLVKKIEVQRQEAALMLMPLAVNRARLFWPCAKRGHLSFLDLISICAEGVMIGLDKFCGPFTAAYRDVAIGRMVGLLIEENSRTTLHFSPPDRRALYASHKEIGIQVVTKDMDYRNLSQQVEKRTNGVLRYEEGDLARLIAASTCVSSDSSPETTQKTLSRMAAPREIGPDVQVEVAEISSKIRRASSKMNLRHRKFMILKGILSIEEARDER